MHIYSDEVWVSESAIKALVLAVTDCTWLISVTQLIIIQTVLFIPFVLVRNLTRLGTLALLADAFIVAGLFYVFWVEIDTIAMNGVAEVKLYNPVDFPLLIGWAHLMISLNWSADYPNTVDRTSIYAFEGICLVRFFSLHRPTYSQKYTVGSPHYGFDA